MKALLLAAGIGSRLAPMTQSIPKCMVPVNGESIIGRQLRCLHANGIDQIYIVCGYKSELLRAHIRTLGYSESVTFIENPDYAVTNNMYSLFLAHGNVCGDDFLMMNADVCFAPEVIGALLSAPDENRIACEKGAFLEESMKLTVNGRITGINKSFGPEESYGTSIDVYRFSKDAGIRLFSIVRDFVEKQGNRNMWSEVAIDLLVRETPFYPCEIHSPWVEIDTPEDLKLASSLFPASGTQKAANRRM